MKIDMNLHEINSNVTYLQVFVVTTFDNYEGSKYNKRKHP